MPKKRYCGHIGAENIKPLQSITITRKDLEIMRYCSTSAYPSGQAQKVVRMDTVYLNLPKYSKGALSQTT